MCGAPHLHGLRFATHTLQNRHLSYTVPTHALHNASPFICRDTVARITFPTSEVAEEFMRLSVDATVMAEQYRIMRMIAVSRTLYEKTSFHVEIERDGAPRTLQFPSTAGAYNAARDDEFGTISDAAVIVARPEMIVPGRDHIPTAAQIVSDGWRWTRENATRIVSDTEIDASRARCIVAGLPEQLDGARMRVMLEAELPEPMTFSDASRLRVVVRCGRGTDGAVRTTSIIKGKDITCAMNETFILRRRALAKMREHLANESIVNVHPNLFLTAGPMFPLRDDEDDACETTELDRVMVCWTVPGRARQLAIVSLTVAVTVTLREAEEAVEGVVCATCLDELVPPVVTCDRCGKAVHAACDHMWRETCARKGWVPSCPLCRHTAA